jgi:hypothetical protein
MNDPFIPGPHPTLDELRATVQKGRHREIGNWLARRVARPTAIYGTWLAVRLGLSAHAVTLAALVASLSGAAAIGTGSRRGFIVGIAFAHLGFWLDHVDGQVARWNSKASLDGVYYDYVMHHLVNLSLGFALGFGLAARSGHSAWAIAGFAIGAGWCLLGLHNDCRYKAFFQRLKSTSVTYRVKGGSGGKPAPPAPWPRRGLGMLTWPAYKSCEPHIVLLALSALGTLALLSEPAWLACWRIGALGMATLAPSIGAARVARSIRSRSTEREFDRWFRPADPAGEWACTSMSYRAWHEDSDASRSSAAREADSGARRRLLPQERLGLPE